VTQGPGDDARSRIITATPSGRTKHAEARRHWKRAQLALNDRLGTATVVALHALIDDGLARLAPEPQTAADELNG
jgi:DNA-binding MarR family transcriptional regulator